MENATYEIDRPMIAAGNVFKIAALESQAIVDAIPDNADVNDECAVIDAACAPVYRLAELILRMPCASKEGEAIKERAQAWMGGHYWSTLEAVK